MDTRLLDDAIAGYVQRHNKSNMYRTCVRDGISEVLHRSVTRRCPTIMDGNVPIPDGIFYLVLDAYTEATKLIDTDVEPILAMKMTCADLFGN